MSLRGIDVSNNDGPIEWVRVAQAGVNVSIAKISEGTFFTDHTFAPNTKGASTNRIKTGGYHFARPSRSTPQDEARFCAKCLDQSGALDLLDMSDLMDARGRRLAALWCDQEDPNVSGTAPLGSWTETFCDALEQLVQRDCGAYLSPGWFESHNADAPAELGDKDLWVATYGASHPDLVRPWNRWVIWQYSDKGSIPGISTPVDLDTVDAEAAEEQEEAMNVRPEDGTVQIPLTGRPCKLLLSCDQPSTVRLAFGPQGAVQYISSHDAEPVAHISQVAHAIPAGMAWASLKVYAAGDHGGTGQPVGVLVDAG